MSFLINPNADIQKVLKVLDHNLFSIVVDDNNKCIGTITDGDLRRALIKGNTADLTAYDICEKNFIFAKSHYEAKTIYKDIRFIPIIDEEKKYISTQINIPNKSWVDNLPLVIMAGGKGRRLKPYTENIPKPLLKIKGKTMLEIIINKAKACGIINIYISINYLGDKIKNYFGNGSKFGVNINYLEETEELGTCGALKNKKLKNYKDLIVINGDVICDLNFNLFYRFHQYRDNDATVAIKKYSVKNPFGVTKFNGLEYIGIEEKPEYISYINAGVYIINNYLKDLIKENEKIDTPDLLSRAKKNKLKCEIYPFDQEWNDVGSIDIYEKLNKQF